MINNQSKGKHVTVVGTDIDEVKELNAHSGLTYNQANQILAEKYSKQTRQSSE